MQIKPTATFQPRTGFGILNFLPFLVSKKWEAITVGNRQSHARCAVPYALLTLGAPCACPTAAADRLAAKPAPAATIALASLAGMTSPPVLEEEGTAAILVVEDWSGIVGNGNVRGTIFAVFDSHLRRGAQRVAVELTVPSA